MLLTKRTHFALLSLVALLQAPGIFAMQQQVEWKKAAQQTAQAMSLNADHEAMLEAPTAKRQKLSPVQEVADAEAKTALAMEEADKKKWGKLARFPMPLRKKIHEFCYSPWIFAEAWMKKSIQQIFTPERNTEAAIQEAECYNADIELCELGSDRFIVENSSEKALGVWDKKTQQAVVFEREIQEDCGGTHRVQISDTVFATLGLVLQIWQVNDNNQLIKLAQTPENERDVPDENQTQFLIKLSSQHLVSSCYDNGRLFLWDISDITKPTLVKIIATHQRDIKGLIRMSDTVFVMFNELYERFPGENFPDKTTHTVSVWDISQSTDKPVKTSTITSSARNPFPQAVLCAISSSEFILAIHNYLYILNINDLFNNPIFRGSELAYPACLQYKLQEGAYITKLTATHYVATSKNALEIWDITNKKNPQRRVSLHLNGDHIDSPKAIKLTDQHSYAFSTSQGLNFYTMDRALWETALTYAPMDVARLQLLLKQMRKNALEKRFDKRKVAVGLDWYMALPDAMKDNIEAHLGAPPFSHAQIKAALERAKQKA